MHVVEPKQGLWPWFLSPALHLGNRFGRLTDIYPQAGFSAETDQGLERSPQGEPP